MSTAAGEYFSRQAIEFGVTAPQILDGSPAVLVDPAKRLSIHMADSIDHQALPQEIAGATRDQVVAVGDYLMQIAEITHPNMKYVDAEPGPLRSGGFAAKSFLQAFTPAERRLKTGHMRNFTAEVITPGEIPDDILDNLLRSATGINRQIRQVTEHTAYLMTTAELHSGKLRGRLGNISLIAVARHSAAKDSVPFSRIVRPAIAVSKPLSTNDMVAINALQESSDNAHKVESYARRHPYSGGLMH